MMTLYALSLTPTTYCAPRKRLTSCNSRMSLLMYLDLIYLGTVAQPVPSKLQSTWAQHNRDSTEVDFPSTAKACSGPSSSSSMNWRVLAYLPCYRSYCGIRKPLLLGQQPQWQPSPGYRIFQRQSLFEATSICFAKHRLHPEEDKLVAIDHKN